MKPEETLEAQARTLGGGWRMEQGVMPLVVLTSVEAARVIERLDKESNQIDVGKATLEEISVEISDTLDKLERLQALYAAMAAQEHRRVERLIQEYKAAQAKKNQKE